MVRSYLNRAFSDELEKIAASKWRKMLRAGSLGADDVARLQNAERRGGGKLLDYGREVRGIDTGTDELIRKHKIPFHTVDHAAEAEAKAALKKGDLKTAVRRGLDARKSKKVKKITDKYGGGASLRGKVYYDPEGSALLNKARAEAAEQGRTLSPTEEQAHRAILKRHEIRETLEGRRILGKELNPRAAAESMAMLRTPGRIGWKVPGTQEISKTAPQSMQDAAAAARTRGKKIQEAVRQGMDPTADSAVRAGKAIERAGQKAQDMGLPLSMQTGGKMQSIGARLQSGARGQKEYYKKVVEPLPAGAVSVGQHGSPMPVIEESMNMQMMPPSVQEQWKWGRDLGESPLLAQHGVNYGTAPTPQQRRQAMKAWENYAI